MGLVVEVKIKELLELDKNPFTPYETIHPDDYEIMSKKITGDIDYTQPLIQRLRDNQGNYKWFEEYTNQQMANDYFL